MSHGKHPALAMCEFVKTYEQEGDGMEPATQDIIVRQCDEGGGPYWVIETDRWSFDFLDDLIDLLKGAGVQSKGAAELVEFGFVPPPSPDATVSVVSR